MIPYHSYYPPISIPLTIKNFLPVLLFSSLAILLSASEAFPGCQSCTPDLSKCMSCEIGFFLLDLSQSPSVCVPGCDKFHTHRNSFENRACIRGERILSKDCESCQLCASNGVDCVDDASINSSPCHFQSFQLPSGECSDFACSSGFYQNSNKACNSCHTSCYECQGPNPNDCLACPKNSYLKIDSYSHKYVGSCLLKSEANPTPNFEIFVTNNATIITDPLGNPLNHQQRNGSAQYPFLDLRDALIRANQLTAPYESSDVDIYLTQGTHFIIKEQESQRYKPSELEELEQPYSLTISPLPCALSSTASAQIMRDCVQQSETVELRVKIGAYFSVLVPQNLTIERVRFDYADSLLKWDSPCMIDRSASCMVTHNQEDDSPQVSALNSECQCSAPLRSIDTCRTYHPLSLFKALPRSPGSSQAKSIYLIDTSISHLYAYYNSIIGILGEGVHISLTRFDYSHISNCGSLVNSFHSFPLRPEIRYSTIQSAFTSSQASTLSYSSSISIINSTFSHLGLALQFDNGTQAFLKSTSYDTSSYDRISPILNLDSFPGEIFISDSQFHNSKLLLDFTLPFDAESETPLSQTSSPVAISRNGILDQSLILVSNHSNGLTLLSSSFYNISTISGIVNIELSPQFQNGVLIAYNSFSSSTSFKSAVALTLSTAYSDTDSYSCLGFHLLQNNFYKLFMLRSEQSLVYLSCAVPAIPQLDSSSLLSLKQINQALQSKSTLRSSLPLPPSRSQSYILEDGSNLIVDYLWLSISHNSFVQNFHRPGEGNILSIDYISHVRITNLTLNRNGDLSFLSSLNSSEQFWKQFSGLHLSKVNAFYGINDYNFWNALASGYERHDTLVSIRGSQNLQIQRVEALQNWISLSSSARSIVLELLDISSSVLLQSIQINTILIDLQSSFIDLLISDQHSLEPSPLIDYRFFIPAVNTPLFYFTSNITLYNSQFYNYKTSSSLITGQSTQQLLIHSCTFQIISALVLVYSSSSLESLIIQNSYFDVIEFSHSLVYPPPMTLTIQGSIFDNSYLFSTTAGMCSFISASDRVSISSSHFVSLNSGHLCSTNLIELRDGALNIQRSTFQHFQSTDSLYSSTNPYFIHISGESTVTMDSTFFYNINMSEQSQIIYLQGSYSYLTMNDCGFQLIHGMLLRSYQSGFAITDTLVMDNTVGASSPALFYNTQSEQRYSFIDSYFINNAGSHLFSLQGMTQDINLASSEPDPYNLGWFVNFGGLLIRDNAMLNILEASGDTRVVIHNTFYLRNVGIDKFGREVHSAFVLRSGELIIDYSYFTQEGTVLGQECSVEVFLHNYVDTQPMISLERLSGLSGIYYTVMQKMCADSPGLIEADISAHHFEFTANVVQNIASLSKTSSILKGTGNPSALFQLYRSTFTSIQSKIFRGEGVFFLVDQSEFSNIYSSAFSINCRAFIRGSDFRYIYSPNQPFMTVDVQDYFDIDQSSFMNIEAFRLLEIECSTGNPNDITIIESSFQNIKTLSSQGSTIKITDLSYTTSFNVGSSHFKNITSLYQYGLFTLGGITDSQTSIIINSIFEDLSAPRGAFLHWDDKQPILHNNTYTRVQSSEYGDLLAGYPIRLALISESDYAANQQGERKAIAGMISEITISSIKSGETLPNFYLAVLDSLGQIVRFIQSNSVELTLLQELQASQVPSPYSHFYTRRNQFNWANGSFAFQNVTVVGEPGKYYSLTISVPGLIDESKAQVIEAANRNGSTVASLKIEFSFCAAGQAFLKTGECQLCPANTYLFDSHSSPINCLKCPRLAQCFGGEDIGPLPGYWRQDKYSLSFLSCLNTDACLGSSYPTQDSSQVQYHPKGSCASNYKGTLCSQCEGGYIRNSRFECSKCPSFTVNLFLCIIFAVLIGTIYFLLICLTRRSMTRPRSVFSIYLKILLNHAQLLMLLSTFRFDWPAAIKSLLAIFETLTDAPKQIFSFDCLLMQFSPFPRFFTTLLFQTLVPVFVTVIIGLLWRIKTRNQPALYCSRFIPSVLIFYFFIHPSVSRLIFQLFNCYKLGSKLYLLQDLSEECYSPGSLHFIFVLGIGIPGILIWIIGFPALLWLVLCEKKAFLNNANVKARLGFLYNGFSPQSYYWEIISIIRKEIVAAISALLIQEGTMVQSFLLLLFLFFFILLTLKVKPYERPLLNNLEMLSLLILILTVFCGLFFLSAQDSTSQYFQHGKNCGCSLEQSSLLIYYSLSEQYGHLQEIPDHQCVGNVLVSTSVVVFVRTEVCQIQKYKTTKLRRVIWVSQKKLTQLFKVIDDFILELEKVRNMYQKNDKFQDKKKFQELLHYFASRLTKINGEKNKETAFVKPASRSMLSSYHNKSSINTMDPLNDSKIEVKPFDFLNSEELDYQFKQKRSTEHRYNQAKQKAQNYPKQHPRLRNSNHQGDKLEQSEFRADSYSIVRDFESPLSERKIVDIQYEVHEELTPQRYKLYRKQQLGSQERKQLRQIVPQQQRMHSDDNFTKLLNDFLDKDRSDQRYKEYELKEELKIELDQEKSPQQEIEIYFQSQGIALPQKKNKKEGRFKQKRRKQSN